MAGLGRTTRTVRMGLAVLLLAVVAPAMATAQEAQGLDVEPGGPRVVVRGSGVDEGTIVGAPPRIAGEGLQAAATATFSVNYSGFTPAARDAFQAAVDIWSTQVTSSVTILIDARFESLPAGELGGAGPLNSFRNFSGAPVANVFYPVALANALSGTDLLPGQSDIDASFSSSVSNWYFGTDGLTPSGQYDFESVVLHELAHGLGFYPSMGVSGGSGSWGRGSPPAARNYDRFGYDQSGNQLVNTSVYPNPSSALGNALQSGAVFFDGPQTRGVNGGNPARLYAPSPWKDGSSFSHLDEATYPAGNANSLLTPFIGTRESIHQPGPIALCMLRDLGWTTPQSCAAATTASSFTSLTPARVVDTRDGTGGFTGKLGPGATINPRVLGVGGVPSTGVDAVVLNVTVTGGTAASFLTVYPDGQPRPNASNLNFSTQDVPNLVVAKVGTDGRVAAYNNAGDVHVIFDVVGWFAR